MQTLDEAAGDFLSARRIAVAGVSREGGGQHGGNIVYQRLRERGYDTFAVNPNADEVEGDRCYHSLADIPGGVEAVVIATRPEVSRDVMADCIDLGITRVWMHRSFGTGSLSEEAAELGRQNGITVIPGGCPLMFEPCADGGHKFMKVILRLTGGVPRTV